MRERAIVLLSGGMDSCVTAAIANQNYDLYFLHINYGQRTERKELQVFNDLFKFYNARDKLIIDFKYLKDIGGSALTDDTIDVPKGLSKEGIPVTYVPFRNANILSAAVSWAEVINATKIFIGATEEDSAGYPDCRKEFYDAFNMVIKKGTKNKNIEIVTPIIDMNKTEIVKLGIKLEAPFELTWSCYEREDKACGECDSCIRRLNAFRNAGVKDPIPYAINIE